MCFIRGHYIAEGGQNMSGRVILYVFCRGHYIAGGGTKYFR